MTTGDEMALVLAKIDAWLEEKEYATGHRTGELLKEAAAEITKLRKQLTETRETLVEARWSLERCGCIVTADRIAKWLKDNPC